MTERLICFDLDGLYFTEKSFQNFKKSIAPNVAKEKRDHVLALSDEMKLFKTGHISEQVYWDYVRDELGITLSNEEIFTILRKSYQINEKVDILIKKLKDLGYKIGICSNNFPTRIRELNKQFHFLEKFDVHIFSYEVETMKPDPKIFERLIEKSNIKAEQIIYSDDKEEKLKGAKSLGIQTFVFRNFEEFVKDLKKYGIKIEMEGSVG